MSCFPRKRSCLILAFLLALVEMANSQKIQYSRNPLNIPNPDEMRLVADVGGNHHLVSIGINGRATVYVFNHLLSLTDKKDLGFSVRSGADLFIIKHGSHYFLYNHPFNSARHELRKITAKGLITDFSAVFQLMVDSIFKRHTSSLQILTANDNLFMVGHVYFDSVKKMVSTVALLEPDLRVSKIYKVIIPFDRENERLQQIQLMGNSLMILKTVRDFEKGHSLEVIKADLGSGKVQMNSFNTGNFLHSIPQFYYRPDSSIVISSFLRENVASEQLYRSVLITELDKDMTQILPATVVGNQYHKTIISSFIFLERYSFLLLNIKAVQNARVYGVKFSVLDENFLLWKDSVAKNDRPVVELQSYPWAQFSRNGKSHLVLVQNFTRRKRGLLIIVPDHRGCFTNISIPVYDRYHYLLDQLQSVNGDYFIVPFLNNNDVGLVKVSLNALDESSD